MDVLLDGNGHAQLGRADKYTHYLLKDFWAHFWERSEVSTTGILHHQSRTATASFLILSHVLKQEIPVVGSTQENSCSQVSLSADAWYPVLVEGRSSGP